MERIRKNHNNIKRKLITNYVSENAVVLDMGCGRGGDLHKWKSAGAKVTMMDPNAEALRDAKDRQKNIGTKYFFRQGDITNAPKKLYDIICFNFSLQYIFCDYKYFIKCMNDIKIRLRKGGKLIGCIPDSEFILMNKKFSDEHGNFFERNAFGQVGDKVNVLLADTPYYSGNMIPEPIAYKDLLITWLENNGFNMIEWSPIMDERTYTISDMYSKFCFVKV